MDQRKRKIKSLVLKDVFRMLTEWTFQIKPQDSADSSRETSKRILLKLKYRLQMYKTVFQMHLYIHGQKRHIPKKRIFLIHSIIIEKQRNESVSRMASNSVTEFL